MRSPRTLAAAALTLGLIAAGAPAAQADPDDPPPFDYSACQFSDGQLSSTTLAVGHHQWASATAVVQPANCGTFDDFETSYPYTWLAFDQPVGVYLLPTDSDDASLSGTVETNGDELDNSVAGKQLTGVLRLSDGTTRPFPGPALVLKREAVFGDMSAPSKVKKNKRFSLFAVLLRANWNEGDYVPYLTKSLNLQSRPSGGKWKSIKKLDTGSGSELVGVRYKTKIKKNTCFRWVHDGSSTTASVTSDNYCVQIKK